MVSVYNNYFCLNFIQMRKQFPIRAITLWENILYQGRPSGKVLDLMIFLGGMFFLVCLWMHQEPKRWHICCAHWLASDLFSLWRRSESSSWTEDCCILGWLGGGFTGPDLLLEWDAAEKEHLDSVEDAEELCKQEQLIQGLDWHAWHDCPFCCYYFTEGSNWLFLSQLLWSCLQPLWLQWHCSSNPCCDPCKNCAYFNWGISCKHGNCGGIDCNDCGIICNGGVCHNCMNGCCVHHDSCDNHSFDCPFIWLF